jgi:hypothetical protein
MMTQKFLSPSGTQRSPCYADGEIAADTAKGFSFNGGGDSMGGSNPGKTATPESAEVHILQYHGPGGDRTHDLGLKRPQGRLPLSPVSPDRMTASPLLLAHLVAQ